jgi:Zn/Cd-binding protein ZinT
MLKMSDKQLHKNSMTQQLMMGKKSSQNGTFSDAEVSNLFLSGWLTAMLRLFPFKTFTMIITNIILKKISKVSSSSTLNSI